LVEKGWIKMGNFSKNPDKLSYAYLLTPMQSQINVGFGSDITIAELAHAISQAVGFLGNIDFDPTQPDGSPRKLMDSTRLNALGWQAQVNLEQGLALAYQYFIQQNSL